MIITVESKQQHTAATNQPFSRSWLSSVVLAAFFCSFHFFLFFPGALTLSFHHFTQTALSSSLQLPPLFSRPVIIPLSRPVCLTYLYYLCVLNFSSPHHPSSLPRSLSFSIPLPSLYLLHLPSYSFSCTSLCLLRSAWASTSTLL